MCDECNVIPCKNGCPNKPVEVLFECDECRGDIYEGDTILRRYEESVNLCSFKCLLEYSEFEHLIAGEENE